MAFVAYSYIDGFNISKQYKCITTIFGAVAFTMITFSFLWTEWHANGDDVRRYIQVMGFQLDILSLAADSMRVVLIFIWKQAIYLLWKPDKSTMITKHVILKWL